MSSINSVFLMLIIAFVLVSCGGDEEDNVAPNQDVCIYNPNSSDGFFPVTFVRDGLGPSCIQFGDLDQFLDTFDIEDIAEWCLIDDCQECTGNNPPCEPQ